MPDETENPLAFVETTDLIEEIRKRCDPAYVYAEARDSGGKVYAYGTCGGDLRILKHELALALRSIRKALNEAAEAE
jgi:hypothetical protein